MRVYTQLTQEQQYQICALMKAEHSQVEIAAIVGVNKSTISREVRRNRGLRGYRPQQAHQFALHRQTKAQPRVTPAHWGLVERLLREDWSPEQISLWLAKEGPDIFRYQPARCTSKLNPPLISSSLKLNTFSIS